VHAAVLSLSLPVPRATLFERPPVLQVDLRELAVPPVVSPDPATLSPPEKRSKPAPQKDEPVPLARKLEAPVPSPIARTEAEAVRAPIAAPEPALAVPAPPPEPAPPPVALQAPAPRMPSSELLATYGQAISQALARYKEYPRIAQMQGWQGAVTMRLRVAPSGRLLDAEVHTSSGYEVLDRQALAMASKVEHLPAPPEGLRDREIAVLVPVVFRLGR
jgi:protein TonB